MLRGFHQCDQRLPEIPDSEALLGHQTHCLDKQFALFLFSLCVCLCDPLRSKDLEQFLIQPCKILTRKG